MGTTATPQHPPPIRQLAADHASLAGSVSTGRASDQDEPQRADRLFPALTAALLSTVGALMLGAAALSLLSLARDGHAEDALLGWVLVTAASLGALLCTRLAVAWSLACTALILGPASRAGRAAIGILRVIAPKLARRFTLGAALATTATGLALHPVMAASPEGHSDAPSAVASAAHSLGGHGSAATTAPLNEHPRPAATATMTAATAGTASIGGLGHSAAASPVPAEGPERSTPMNDEPPPLGWEQQPSPPGTAASDSDRPAADSSAPREEHSPSETHTITVHAGDTLWSLSDDLLGPGADSPAQIASVWPELYEANRDQIGPEPDRLTPGQELVVPDSLTVQENS